MPQIGSNNNMKYDETNIRLLVSILVEQNLAATGSGQRGGVLRATGYGGLMGEQP